MTGLANDHTAPGIIRWRFVLVLLVMAALLVMILVRLISLHTVDQPFLFEEGEKRIVRAQLQPARRGMITDRFGKPLAVSTAVVDISLNPQVFDVKQAGALADVLDMPAATLAKEITEARQRGRGFYYVDRQVQPAQADRVAALGLDGLQFDSRFRRYYPAAEVTSHLVGIVDIDGNGQEGMELAYNDYLTGTGGRRTVIRDRYGRVVKQLVVESVAQPGHDLRLTIDLRLQYLAYRELMAAVRQHQATSGSAVLLDAHNGEVLALVNQPSYNPNNRAGLKPEFMRNRALADVLEPGSTMKPFTVAAALDSGRYTPDTPIDTSPGYLRIKNKTIRDHRNYGVLDVTGVITKSSNVGVSLISADLGADVLFNIMRAAGLGQASGLGFPGESVGILPYPEQMDDLRLATVSYGYGMAVSPLQLAQSYTSFTQHGCRFNATLLLDNEARPGCKQVMSADTARKVLDILETVTSDIGTGRRARVAGYRVGGKTGTAHKVGDSGYEDSTYNAVFAGIAPLTDPDLVLVVAIDEPQGREYYGGEVAAPVFSRIMEQALRLRQIAPDDSSAAALIVAGDPR
ncbi:MULTISPECIES: penicillin-binding protein 2 [unclassified Oceanobacter]|uniref:peptidoglycan D,D-transpeptidase FtsI family protein n=1 Tax=unclassified Oceanobacter TaxID=2620260 RepID=UPI00273733DB|nr:MULTISPECIES: penicillin-binding protein 2 [unclassified Oceanobacter]MDP2609957.1 penicillin-binding protein 2 [Oceanobacter sp. 1_MG-2023]MDP2613227.1 penicillin-binding protein 2 [Oceanobacter sp. 2_MG-2023]